jgi:hypothetical protein
MLHDVVGGLPPPIGVGLCRIVDMNFGEFTLGEVGCIPRWKPVQCATDYKQVFAVCAPAASLVHAQETPRKAKGAEP